MQSAQLIIVGPGQYPLVTDGVDIELTNCCEHPEWRFIANCVDRAWVSMVLKSLMIDHIRKRRAPRCTCLDAIKQRYLPGLV